MKGRDASQQGQPMRWVTDRDAWISEVVANPRLSPQDKLVLIAVSKYMSDYNGGLIETAKIAGETALSSDEVIAALRRLEGSAWSITEVTP